MSAAAATHDSEREDRLARARAAQVYHWRAVRSASTMTITGIDADGNAVKLTGITSIGPDPEGECSAAVFAVGTGPDGATSAWTLRLVKRPS